MLKLEDFVYIMNSMTDPVDRKNYDICIRSISNRFFDAGGEGPYYDWQKLILLDMIRKVKGCM